jgi:uncharacterized protein (DUF1778 family)
MAEPRKKSRRRTGSLMIRLDAESKAILTKAAEMRGVKPSDYVREVTVAEARKEVLAASERSTDLAPEEQLAFWNALNASPILTPEQRRLGKLMRGEL